jgi:hypothetical protein
LAADVELDRVAAQAVVKAVVTVVVDNLIPQLVRWWNTNKDEIVALLLLVGFGGMMLIMAVFIGEVLNP